MLTVAVRRIARRLGVDIRRSSARNDVDVRRSQILADNGTTVVLDIGANVGQYAAQLRRTGYKGRVVSFEPGREAFAALRRRASDDDQWSCFQLGLGDRAETGVLRVSSNLSSSSLMEISPVHVQSAAEAQVVGSENIELTTLDACWEDIVAPEDTPFLKLDVQGYELKILRGAGARLNDVSGVEVEVSLVPLYEGQPLFRDVVDYLDARDFALVSVEPGFTDAATGRLLQMDCIFVPHSSEWWRHAAGEDSP
jgi:FkbM family methyltransferase